MSSRLHLATGIGAILTGLCALLAMNCRMFSALVTTGLANICAQFTDRFGKNAVARHHGGCRAADLGAIHVQGNTSRHHFNVVFLQA